MTNKDILANQIIVDINSLIKDTEYGLDKDAIVYQLRLIKLKIRDLYAEKIDEDEEMTEDEEAEAEAEAEQLEIDEEKEFQQNKGL